MKSSHQNMLTPVVNAAEMRKHGSVHTSINSSNDSMSPKRKKESPNKKSVMGAFVPKDCAVDIDKDYIYSIGKDIFKNVASAQKQNKMKTRANILSDKINDKMDELKFKLRTLDGGSCLTHIPLGGEENERMKLLMQKKRAALGRRSS